MPYQIIKPNKLSDTEIRDINNLVSLCNQHDHLRYTFDPNDDFKKDSDINHFLLYDKDRLLSVVILFTPRKEAEVSAFTHPEFRRKGLFSRLLNEARIELTRREIPDFLFLCDKNSKDGKTVVEHLKAVYEFSEYSMKLNPDKMSDLKMEAALHIRGIIVADKPALKEILKISFNEFKDEAEEYIDELFLSKKRIFHTVLFKDKIIGMIGVYPEGNKYYIHGFCIDPQYRAKGLGSQVLNFIVKKFHDLDPEKGIELEVRVENIHALSLYEKIGFQIMTAYDYSRLPVHKDP
jgi:ribosomal protein S18 acetylase RimI-like enzyme